MQLTAVFLAVPEFRQFEFLAADGCEGERSAQDGIKGCGGSVTSGGSSPLDATEFELECGGGRVLTFIHWKG